MPAAGVFRDWTRLAGGRSMRVQRERPDLAVERHAREGQPAAVRRRRKSSHARHTRHWNDLAGRIELSGTRIDRQANDKRLRAGREDRRIIFLEDRVVEARVELERPGRAGFCGRYPDAVVLTSVEHAVGDK